MTLQTVLKAGAGALLLLGLLVLSGTLYTLILGTLPNRTT